ncbi:MAG: hypothetical protein H6652_12095 [Ardenticatenaceae bacterium]|nr:hypothetical protein [Ardenticatenaceae bacterium]MCB8947508.1 hypothetical protein [Ardenticatenaceae bacterium]
MDEPIVFRARKKYRVQRLVMLILGITLLGFIGLLSLVQEGNRLAHIILYLVFGVLPIVLGFRSNWKSPKKLNFVLHGDSIGGSIGKQTFQLPFSKILHIENLGHALRIDATDSQHLLEKRHFDLEQIQVELKKRLHPDVFVDGGWVNLPAYQPIKEQKEAVFVKVSAYLPLRVKQELPLFLKVMGVIGIIFFSIATFFSWQQLGYGSLFFLFFAVLCVIGLLQKGVWEIDSDQISYETRFKKYRILWEDVNRVEHDNQLAFAFIGRNQCLKIPWSHEFRWEPKQKELFYFFLDYMIERKNIERRRSQWASVRLNKNTRVVT